MKVEFEPSQGWLGVTVDDTKETAPVTVIVPLRETSVGAPSEGAISFSCSSPCITTTGDRFASAVQKLSAGRSAALSWPQHRPSIQFGCQAERCVAIRRAILKLADMAKRANTKARPPEATEIVARINALTAKLDYVAPDGTRVLSYRYTTTLNRETRALTVTRDVVSFVATHRQWLPARTFGRRFRCVKSRRLPSRSVFTGRAAGHSRFTKKGSHAIRGSSA